MHERLRDLRKKKGYTQIAIQMMTNIDQSDYSKIETGRRYMTDESRPHPRSKSLPKKRVTNTS